MNLFGAQRVLNKTIDTTSNTVTIIDGCLTYKDANLTGILDFSKIQNPQSIMPTGSIIVTIKDSNQFAVS